jgi:hypothetical protein
MQTKLATPDLPGMFLRENLPCFLGSPPARAAHDT